MNRCLSCLIPLCAAGFLTACAVPARLSAPTSADPAPGFLRQYAETNRFRSGRPNSFVLTPDGSTVLYLRSGPRDRVQSLYAFDVGAATERVLLRAADLLGGGDETLSPEEKARRERARQTAKGLASFQLSKDGTKLLVPLSGRLFVASMPPTGSTEAPRVSELKPGVANAPAPLDPRFSPDGAMVAFLRGGELWVTEVASGAERQLTTGATETVGHGEAEFVAQEEMGRGGGYWWSPDSRSIAYQETDVAAVEEVFIADPLRPFAKPQSWRYPRAGKANARVRLGVLPVGGGETRWLEWDREAFPYLATVKWDRPGPIMVLVQNRAQTAERLLAFDLGGGPGGGGGGGAPTSRLLIEETDPAWINLDQQMPWTTERFPGFLWTTESMGWNQLEWRGRSGAEQSVLAGQDINFRSVVGAGGPERRELLVIAGEDPNQSHLYSLAFTQGGITPTCLTCGEPGLHGAVLSKDGSTLVITTSPQDGPVRTEVYRREPGQPGLGKLVGTIPSAADAPMVEPRVEWTTVSGAAEWPAAIVRPRGFKGGAASGKYPVICSVYTGPTAQTVTRHAGAYLLQQWIADHGFIVVSIDNRGTPGRGRAWERMTKGDLIDLQLNDQCEALRLLGARYPEMDLSRVGVFGWSFGGYYSAMAACRRPDVYKAACAGAPVIDWADYDTHYTERYLGTPESNPKGYANSNVVTHAGQLGSPLLLIHGSADDNVYFTHSLKLMDAVVRNGKSDLVEFMPLAGQTHVVVEPEVVERVYGRMMDFFVRTLGREAVR